MLDSIYLSSVVQIVVIENSLVIIKIWNGNTNSGEFYHDLSSNQ